MPKFTDIEKNERILAYIDNEVSEEEAIEIKEYIETNKEANNRYQRLKNTKNFFKENYQNYNKEFDINIKNKIAKYPLEKENKFNNLFSNILNKFIIKFSLPNFVAGGAIAGLIGYLTLSAVPTVSTLTHMNAGFELKKPEMERIERILGNQPANLPKLKKEIESLIVEKSTPAIDNNSVKLKSANSSHVIKIENNLVQINKIDDCLVIKILNSSNDSTNYICQNENNEWKFQNK